MKRSLPLNSSSQDQQARVRPARINARERLDDEVEQAPRDAQMVPRDQEPNQALANILQLRKPMGVNRAWPLTKFSAAPPTVEVRDTDFQQLKFPNSVWRLILSHLDEADLRKVGLTCRGLNYFTNGQTPHAPLDPASASGAQQMRICCARLDPILLAYVQQCQQQCAYIDVAPFAQRYGEALQHLASNFRCLEVNVFDGFEAVVEGALASATRWQFVRMRFGDNADASLISRLEQALKVNERNCRIELDLSGSEMKTQSDWQQALPTGQALTLNALNLRDLYCSKLAGLQPLLESANCITSLKFFADSVDDNAPDPILPWLQRGTPALTSLHIGDGPSDGKLLLEMLKTKTELTSFTLDNARLKANGFTLANILAAAPKLKRLELALVAFERGASVACTRAMQASVLEEIKLDSCELVVEDDVIFRGRQENTHQFRAQAAHKELLHGLRRAPLLKTLHVGLGPFQQSAELIIKSFYLNPAARVLRCWEFEKPKLLKILAPLNAIRADAKLSPIQLECIAFKHHLPEPDNYGYKLVDDQREELKD